MRNRVAAIVCSSLAMFSMAAGKPLKIYPRLLLPTSSPDWRIMATDEGCLVYFYGFGSTVAEVRPYTQHFIQYRWEGTCTRGKLINGPGAIVEVEDLMFSSGTPGQSINRWQCTMVNGLCEGTVIHSDVYPRGPTTYPAYRTSRGCAVQDRFRIPCNPAPPPPGDLIERR